MAASHNRGPRSNIMGLPPELDLMIWDILDIDSKSKFPRLLIEIRAIKTPKTGHVEFEISRIHTLSIGLGLPFSSRAFYLSPNRYKLDCKIINPHFFCPAIDILFFRDFNTLKEFAAATKESLITDNAPGTEVKGRAKRVAIGMGPQFPHPLRNEEFPSQICFRRLDDDYSNIDELLE
ncbi:hypothetical protein NHQ30_008545 [Ciborinia camelliae]|nr:hypothetical protein NHQ30_008545 [Ciborinia camelliae]